MLTGLLVIIALRVRRNQVIYTSLLTGLLYDSLSPAPLGISLPFFLLLGGGLFALREKLFTDRIITYSILGLLSVLLKTIYFSVVLSVCRLRPLHPDIAMVRIAGGFIPGALIVPLVYLFLAALRHARPEIRRRVR